MTVLQRIEEVHSQQYMTDLEGILTDGGEFGAEREKKTKIERNRKSQLTQNRVSNSQNLLRAENISSVDLVRAPEMAKSPEGNSFLTSFVFSKKICKTEVNNS
jgi:hypothetical protein